MFVKLVEDVKAYGGEVLMFSSMHESGQRASLLLLVTACAVGGVLELRSCAEAALMPERADHSLLTELNQLTGIAAILTYPLDIEVVEEEERVEAEDRAAAGDATSP